MFVRLHMMIGMNSLRFSLLLKNKQTKTPLGKNLFPSEEFEFKPFATDEPFSLNFEYAEEVYWQAGTKLRDNIVDIRPLVLRKFSEKKSVVVEFGQAFWLDKRHGFTPNVTASHTFSSEVFQSACIPLREMSQIGCCKAYDTKVGTHHFITKIDPSKSKLAHKLAKLEFGTSTGRQRMVGWFDAVEKGNALRFGGFEYLVINKLDALSSTNEEFNEIKICIGYENPDGQEVSTVPRCEKKHKELKPIYEKLPVWTEDISDCKKFEQLPSNAQNYVSRMFQAVCFNAYGENWFKHKLPKLLFIGVGPDPKQIIQDIPSFYPKKKTLRSKNNFEYFPALNHYRKRINWEEIDNKATQNLLKICLTEDLGEQGGENLLASDATTKICQITANGKASIVSREALVLCGIGLVPQILEVFNSSQLKFNFFKKRRRFGRAR